MDEYFPRQGLGGRDGKVLSFPVRPRLGVAPVKRLEAFGLVELGIQLERYKSATAPDTIRAIDLYMAVFSLQHAIKQFREQQPAFGLASDNADEVMEAAESFLQEHFYDSNNPARLKEFDSNAGMQTWLLYRIKPKLEEFVHVLSAACRKSESYFFGQKLGYEVTTLLHEAEKNIHESVLQYIGKDAIDEIRSAGRCLAVENYTASGFHVLRSLEVVMGDYYKKATGSDKEFKSWYDYVSAFKELEDSREARNSAFPSPKVAAMLDRMRQLDRNPLMHPRDTLDEMGADTLFKLGIATLTELAKDVRDMAGQSELQLVQNDAREAS